jgi:hypothetical protein
MKIKRSRTRWSNPTPTDNTIQAADDFDPADAAGLKPPAGIRLPHREKLRLSVAFRDFLQAYDP